MQVHQKVCSWALTTGICALTLCGVVIVLAITTKLVILLNIF